MAWGHLGALLPCSLVRCFVLVSSNVIFITLQNYNGVTLFLSCRAPLFVEKKRERDCSKRLISSATLAVLHLFAIASVAQVHPQVIAQCAFEDLFRIRSFPGPPYLILCTAAFVYNPSYRFSVQKESHMFFKTDIKRSKSESITFWNMLPH